MRFGAKFWILTLLVPVVVVMLWLLAPFYPEGMRVVGHGPAYPKDIALTFDDGPNPAATPEILDILDQYHAKATFFLIGTNVQRHPDTAKMIIARGQEIGNHSMTHSYYLPYDPPSEIVLDYLKAEETIKDATGVAPTMYRPPHGRITPWMESYLRKQGLTLVGWTYSPRDWENPGVDSLVQRVVSRAKPGAIFLFHDGLDLEESPNRQQTVEALPKIIEELQAKGYRLVTVGYLLRERQYFQESALLVK